MNFSLLDPILIFLEIYYVFLVYLFWCGLSDLAKPSLSYVISV